MRQDYLLPLIESLIDEKLSKLASFSIGVVVDVDPTKYLAKVQLHFEQIETSFLRIASGYVGSNFGQRTPINVGDEVTVAFYNFDYTSGIIIGRLYNDPQNLPFVAGQNDWLIQHRNGAKLVVKDSGEIDILSSGGASATLKADGSLVLTDPTGKQLTLNATGQLLTNTGSAGDNQAVILKAFLTFFDDHVHVGNLGFPTSPPTILSSVPLQDLVSDGS